MTVPDRHLVPSFETDRLLVTDWHEPPPSDPGAPPLDRLVQDLLTDRVTEWLPDSWSGHYTLDRARSWIEERDQEGQVLLATLRSTGVAVGLLFVAAIPKERPNAAQEIRIGYLLAERHWGKGMATELVYGLVSSLSGSSFVVSAGVKANNRASIAVLEKAGFAQVADENSDDGDLTFRTWSDLQRVVDLRGGHVPLAVVRPDQAGHKRSSEDGPSR